MSKDMKRSRNRGSGGGSSLLTGLLIGLLAGVLAAVVLAFYLNRGNNPFSSVGKEVPADAVANASGSPARKGPEVLRPGSGSKQAEPETDFDFYKVLPELSEGQNAKPTSVPSPVPAPEASAPARVEAPRGTYLQVGAFQNEQDADNLKAKLALVGVEASIYTADVPDKGVWHRVRIGPFNSLGDLERTRELLKNNGVDGTVVRGN